MAILGNVRFTPESGHAIQRVGPRMVAYNN